MLEAQHAATGTTSGQDSTAHNQPSAHFEPHLSIRQQPSWPAKSDTPPATMRRIALAGFMGAGKSTVGCLLAQRLGWNFQDLDTLIEEREGKSIPKLIEIHGEAAFRRMESNALAAALGRSNIVLALGGGATEALTNRLLLEQTPATVNIFLHAPLEVLLGRCATQPNAAVRPFLADPAQVALRYQQRLPHYRRLARITLDTTLLDPVATVDLLLTEFASKAMDSADNGAR